jgi:hypothetical protein
MVQLDDVVPNVHLKKYAYTFLILNIIFPGLGTLCAGIIQLKASKVPGISKKLGIWTVVFAVLQLLLAVFLIGWIWSLVWGILIVVNCSLV